MSKYFLEDEFEVDFLLIGITSHSNDYRVSWAINQALGINLSKEKDVSLESKNAETSIYSNYYYEDMETDKAYRLLSNKFKKQLLIAEQKPADFLFMVYGDEQNNIQDILTILRNINIVLMCFEINVSNLKSKENLLF